VVVPLVALAKSFAAKVGGIPVVGEIDYIDDVPGSGSTIVELKTGAKKWNSDQIEKSTQLTLYAEVEGSGTARIDEVIKRATTKTRLTATAEIQQFQANRSVQDRKVFVEDLQETAHLIKLGVFPKAPIDSWKCSADYCDYWKECRGKART
jgi:RecB family exonuclease